MILDLKPYPEYRDSGLPWLGQVPGHWQVQPVRRIGRVQGGKALAARAAGRQRPYLRVANVFDGRIDTRQVHTMPFSDAEFPRYRLALDDVLLNEGQSIELVGRAARYVGEPPECAFQNSLIRVQSRGTVVPRFLELLFRHTQAVGTFAVIATQTTSIAHLGVSRLADLPLAFPPIPDQQAIVRYLDWATRRLEPAIRAKRKVIALLNEQKQAIIERAVTRGLDPSVPLKPSGISWLGDIPRHWDVRRAKYHYREVDERSTDGGEELLSVSHLTGVTPRSQKQITMFKAASYVGHKLCRPGDLVVNTMWAWMGALGVSAHRGIISPAYAVYRPRLSESIVGSYIDGLLHSKPYVSNIICRSTGLRGSRLRLYPEEFFRLPIIQPPAGEQQRIVEWIQGEAGELDAAIAHLKREIDLLREYGMRLTADMVAGKLDVREAAARLPDEAAAGLGEEDSGLRDEAEAADEEAAV